MREATTTAMTAHVLYIDHVGHPAPLTECYHATASRRLASSAVDRYPPTTVTETDSAYCPQCLSFHDASSAARTPCCAKATCQRCPICLSVASVTARDRVCYFRCGLCEWTSLECNLGVDLGSNDDEGDEDRPGGGGSVDRLQLARAADDLLQALQARRNNEPLEAHCKALTDYWDDRRRGQQSRSHAQDRALRRSVDDRLGGWSVAVLEASMAEKRTTAKSSSPSQLQGFHVERLTFDDVDYEEGEEPPDVDESMQNVPVGAFQLQVLNSTRPVQFRRDLLPLPTLLRPRKSRRCRAELAEGRAGILLKPRLNPLEGDSSLRSGHGQWWKKDSSAVHVIPRVSVVHDVPVRGGRRFLLKVSNPTLGSLRLRFAASPYQGEPTWDDPSQTADVLSGLRVDSFSPLRANARLRPDLVRDLRPSEPAELLSAEDSIIELGGRANATPQDVEAWRSAVAAIEGIKPCFRRVAQSASMAWYEWTVPGLDATNDGLLVDVIEDEAVAAVALPLRLEVEVGAGSWETSLIQPQEMGDGSQVDRVPFDLILVCR